VTDDVRGGPKGIRPTRPAVAGGSAGYAPLIVDKMVPAAGRPRSNAAAALKVLGDDVNGPHAAPMGCR